MRLNDIQTYFKNQFGNPDVSLKSPGRINIIGEHTDYGNGYVLPTAIDRCTYFFVSQSKHSQHDVHAYNLNESIHLDMGNEILTHGWRKYIEAVFIILRKARYPIGPTNMVFGGDIPLGAGISSSTALSCGCIYALSELYNLNLSKEEIALLSQQTEHLVGAKGGLMDQYAILFSEKGYAIQLDCLSLTNKMIPIQLEGVRFSLINSNIPHDLSSSDTYNMRRKIGEQALALIQEEDALLKRLSDLTPQQLATLKSRLPSSEYDKIDYIYQENKRVQQVTKHLLDGDASAIGKCLNQTHQGLSKQYGVSLPEVDNLVDIVVKKDGIHGARMMGGGFGGSVLILGESKSMESNLQDTLEEYHANTQIRGEIIDFELADGIELIA